jgi:hypothetical protein
MNNPYIASVIEADDCFLGTVENNKPCMVGSIHDAKKYWDDEFCKQEAMWMRQFFRKVTVHKYEISYVETSTWIIK